MNMSYFANSSDDETYDGGDIQYSSESETSGSETGSLSSESESETGSLSSDSGSDVYDGGKRDIIDNASIFTKLSIIKQYNEEDIVNKDYINNLHTKDSG